MEGSVIDLAKYRLVRAKEDLETAADNLKNGKYRASVNRSYYAVFHSIRAITALDHFDSSKHSGVIAFFNQHYVKPGVFDKELSKMIDSCYRLREKADYDDLLYQFSCSSRAGTSGALICLFPEDRFDQYL